MSYIGTIVQWASCLWLLCFVLYVIHRTRYHYKLILKERETKNALVDKEPSAEWSWHASQAPNVTDIRSAMPRVTYTLILTQGADGYLAVRVADVADTEENRARIAHALRRTADLLDPN